MTPEIRTMLEAERDQPCARDAKERIARRLDHAALCLTAIPTPSPANPGWGIATKAMVALALVGAGAVGGALLQTTRDHASAPPPAVAAPAEARREAPPQPAGGSPAVRTVDVDSLPLVPLATASPAAGSSAARVIGRTSLSEEQRLVDTARSAVARGAYSAALATLGEHESRFPEGSLAEERELLMVQALAGTQRTAEARARGEQFARQYPRSIFLPAVRKAAGTPTP